MNYAKTIKIVPAKPRVIFPHLINLSRSSIADYLKDPKDPKEFFLDGAIGQVYFNAAHGVEAVGVYEQMAKSFDLNGDIDEG